jgi:Tfp pilus assembly protein PilX
MKVTKLDNHNQQGVVSIIVTMIIMVVLTLVVTGFAQLARREQREVLDRQLATQALYAAESGINAAQSVVLDEIADDNYTNADDCGDYESNGHNLSEIGTASAVPTCILTDKTPKKLLLPNIQTNKSKVVPIIQGAGTLDSITVSWQNQDQTSSNSILCTDANCPFTPTGTAWGNNNVGVLRVDLVPTKSTEPNLLNPDGLRDKMFTAFLIPTTSGGGTVAYSQAAGVSNQGMKVAANCPATTIEKKCSVVISGLNIQGRTQYYMRLKSIYNISDVVICPSAASGLGCDPDENMVGAQAIIDVTAKAADVLKRVQVRIPIEPLGNIPEYALESSADICKLLEVAPPPSTTTSTCPSGP